MCRGKDAPLTGGFDMCRGKDAPLTGGFDMCRGGSRPVGILPDTSGQAERGMPLLQAMLRPGVKFSFHVSRITFHSPRNCGFRFSMNARLPSL